MEVGGLLSLLHYGDGLVGGILFNSVQLERKGRMIAISTAKLSGCPRIFRNKNKTFIRLCTAVLYQK